MKTLLPACILLCATTGAAWSATPTSAHPATETLGRMAAEPDVVLRWNAEISHHFTEFSIGATPHIQARVYAMVHLAMHDALGAVRREERSGVHLAFATAAASFAAHDVMISLRPAGAKRYAALHERQLVALGNAQAVQRGRVIGQRSAAALLAKRADDGWPASLARRVEQGALSSAQARQVISTPFVIKRAQQLQPEPPYYAYSDGVLMPNLKLRNRKFIGTPETDGAPPGAAQLWCAEPILRWNDVARSLASQSPRDLHAHARLFAALNTALADALISSTYWNAEYRNGRMERPVEVLGATDTIRTTAITGEPPPHPAGPWWVAMRLTGFPAVPAALAGAADAILLPTFSGEARPTIAAAAEDHATDLSLHMAIRHCGWAALVDGGDSSEGCVAGYELGRRIGEYVLKQERR